MVFQTLFQMGEGIGANINLLTLKKSFSLNNFMMSFDFYLPFFNSYRSSPKNTEKPGLFHIFDLPYSMSGYI